MPLVAIGHGFTGNRNSGGASELAAAVWQAAASQVCAWILTLTHALQRDSPQTHAYTLSSMQDRPAARHRLYARSPRHRHAKRIGLYARSMGGRVAMTMANEQQRRL